MKGDFVYPEERISFTDVSWGQVEELTLQSVIFFKFSKERLIGLPRLRVLRMPGTLKSIPYPEAFLVTPSIEVLDLSNNLWLSLKSVVSALNNTLPNLKYLDLGYVQNGLSEPFILDKDFAMAIEGKPLINLNVSNTKISLFDDGLTSKSIRYLNLSYTSGSWFVRNPNLNLFPNLEEIDISYTTFSTPNEYFIEQNSQIRQEVSCFRFLSSTKRFILNNIRMTYPIYLYNFSVEFNCSTIGVEEVYIRDSDIRWLNVNTNIILLSLKIINLEENYMEYLSPEIMKKAPNLREIYLAGNILSGMVDLGILFEGNSELEIVDLSHNRLRSIPSTMFATTPSLSILRLQGNALSIFHCSMEKLQNLKLLDLRDNMIKYVSRDTISGLLHTGFDHNRWGNTVFDKITSFINESESLLQEKSTVLLLKSFVNQLVIDFTGNLMECTCDRIWFNEWIILTNITLSGKQLYQCKFENGIHYMTNDFLNDLRYHCKLMDFLGVVIATPCTVFLMITCLIIIIIKRRNDKKILHRQEGLLERYNQNENIDQQRYFMFLSFAGKDDELVNNYIYPELEIFLRDKFGNNGNLICTGDTHFTPGRWIAEEIDRCLNKCDVFIMVVTPHFLQSDWCKYEVLLAKQKKKFKILLVSEEVFQQKIPSVLKDILKLCTRATWRLQDGQFFIKPEWRRICEGMIKGSLKTANNIEEEDTV
ncbi:hypothetical protein CHS0354_023139 [Potamilus streckersoni]|uniref:TIR domain-containing protein n=1 Tax=Potamilus streckersoni TaxID=2493646 RepID=A0AAE0RNH8_9BIVA|nr:hypothetical protein CHS0354_023139 [Potamilus streckersoni]